MAAGNRALLLWAVSLIAIASAAAIWSRVAWRGVRIEATFKPSRVFSSEPLVLRVRIANGKRLPLPMVRASIWLPLGLTAAPGYGSATMRGFQRRFTLAGHSEVVLDLPVQARRRGEYWLERVLVSVSDPFGLVPLPRDLTPEAVLLVMPEPRIGIPMEVRRRLPFGQPALAARIFEERERFAGVRPYEAGDPLNRIHWKLTGHTGGLATKLFEPTRSADVMIAMDLAAGEPFWDNIYPAIAEDVIGWGCYLARQAIEAGWRVGLVAERALPAGPRGAAGPGLDRPRPRGGPVRGHGPHAERGHVGPGPDPAAGGPAAGQGREHRGHLGAPGALAGTGDGRPTPQGDRGAVPLAAGRGRAPARAAPGAGGRGVRVSRPPDRARPPTPSIRPLLAAALPTQPPSGPARDRANLPPLLWAALAESGLWFVPLSLIGHDSAGVRSGPLGIYPWFVLLFVASAGLATASRRHPLVPMAIPAAAVALGVARGCGGGRERPPPSPSRAPCSWPRRRGS